MAWSATMVTALLVGAAPLTAPPPARPERCVPVDSGTLGSVLAAAHAGESLCLAPGTYAGPLQLAAGVTLWGPRGAVIRSSGSGTTVRLLSGARLLGVTVDGSGARFDVLDAAVHLEGEAPAVDGVKVVHALFGILVEKARHATVRGNVVVGSYAKSIGLRGDAIRLWETTDSRVEGNTVAGGRDVVVWYSSRNQLLRNEVRDGRYGTHFMYSHDNLVEGNRYLGDEVGIFVMYSHGLTLRDNLIADAAGAAGMGIGLKESGALTVVGNRLIHDTVGIYLDTSPLQVDDHNAFERNLIRLCETGVIFHSSESRNTFEANALRDNRVQVAVEGGGDALGVTFRENDFDDYRGYDLDGDGFGDLPYEEKSLSSELLADHPALAFFASTPALALVREAGEVLPIFAPRTLLRDERPRLRRYPWEDADAR